MRARSNLARARQAILVHRGVAFPKTHAIADLLTLVARSGVDVPPEVQDATLLTPYAVEARYPGVGEEVTAADHQEAVQAAQQVVAWAEAVVRSARS
jgi:HEPN domain-containing protein